MEILVQQVEMSSSQKLEQCQQKRRNLFETSRRLSFVVQSFDIPRSHWMRCDHWYLWKRRLRCVHSKNSHFSLSVWRSPSRLHISISKAWTVVFSDNQTPNINHCNVTSCGLSVRPKCDFNDCWRQNCGGRCLRSKCFFNGRCLSSN